MAAMKIGFSSLVCPTWDLPTIVAKAAEWGYQGIELRGLQGELHLPAWPQLSADPEAVRRRLNDSGVELVCLGSSVTLTSKSRRELSRQKEALNEYIELAHRLGCAHVRIHAGEVPRRDTQRAVLSRVAEQLIGLAPAAARAGVTILVENGGDFPGSADMWFLLDAVSHPAVRCCWNQCSAMSIGERATTSLPRLGGKISLVHLCDAEFDEQGILQGYKPLGEGHAEVARQIDLLKGLVYTNCLMFEWPKLWLESLPAPETILPGAATFMKDHIAAKQAILSAYKGDKNAPKFAQPRSLADNAA